ncbi:hypothetical protein FRC04_006698, partial [Tulasnella sp. 424]
MFFLEPAKRERKGNSSIDGLLQGGDAEGSQAREVAKSPSCTQADSYEYLAYRKQGGIKAGLDPKDSTDPCCTGEKEEESSTKLAEFR